LEVTTGFLVVKTFERMCREYLATIEQLRQTRNRDVFPIPPEQMPGKYRGIARDPIQPWVEDLRDTGLDEPTEEELAASLFMDELTKSRKEEGDFIFALDDACKLLEMIPQPPEREIIWVRRMDRGDLPPPETAVLGYEPTEFFASNHCSLIASCAFFRHWRPAHGDDQKKMRFRALHARLNKWGLFDTPAEAEQYLDLFLQLLSGQESEVYYIAEIRSVT
jgi:hypothetical protein